MYAIPCLHSKLGREVLVSCPSLSPPWRDGKAVIGLRAKAILLPKWLTGPHMATHPQNVFLESYFAKPNLKEGTAHVSKLQVKMFLLGFNLTFFCPNPNPTLLNMSQISPVTQAPLVADHPPFF